MARRFGFRFGFVYWMLFCAPLLVMMLPGVDRLGTVLLEPWNRLGVWVGNHLLGIERPIFDGETGSGDTTLAYIQLLCRVVIAVVAAAIWSSRDKEDTHPRLSELLRVTLRYTLGLIMIVYGVGKVCGGQFASPGHAELLRRYGDSSPMGLLWTFMGYSRPYVFFTGAAEALGAGLLLFRRTTTLGALVLGAVLANVLMLNLCYDVPVKIDSAHFLAMCLVLLAPDFRRLADLLIFNRPTQPVDRSLVLPKVWMRRARPILKVAVIAMTLVLVIRQARTQVARVDEKSLELPLMSRGFHWINETPYNR